MVLRHVVHQNLDVTLQKEERRSSSNSVKGPHPHHLHQLEEASYAWDGAQIPKPGLNQESPSGGLARPIQ